MAGRGAPRASIVVPSYDHAAFVVGAVRSALDQTEPDVEVIVIDDGSRDDSLARLAEIDDPRVQVLSQDNRGLSRTLNRGLELARARWVKFLPSDDMLVPSCLARELAAAEEPGVGLVFCLPEVVGADGRPLPDPAPQAWFDTAARDERELLVALVERNFLSAPGALFDRDLALAAGGFDPDMRVAQDYDLWLKLLPRCRARLVPERLVRVRWHGKNQSAVATPETEAERVRALVRTLADVGRDGWIARFADDGGGRLSRAAAARGRRALAGALVRSGIEDVRALARALEGEADALERGGLASVARGLAHGARAAVRAARHVVRPAWQSALRRRARAVGGPGGGALRAAAGPRRERWLVLDPDPVASPDGSARGRRLAEALARSGAQVAYAARAGGEPRAAGGADAGPADLPWDRAPVRRWLADGDDRLRVLVEAPHPEAIALAREARALGARVLFDRAAAWEARGVSWYDAASEARAIAEADDLVADARPNAVRLAAGGRVVHLLAAPPPGDAASARRTWDAHAASLAQIAARPTATALVIASDAGALAFVDALSRARCVHAVRVAVVLLPAADAGLEHALAAHSKPGPVAVFRSAHPDRDEARAIGVRATAGEIVALIDGAAGSALADGWLDDAVAVLLAHADVGAVAIAGGRARASQAGPPAAAGAPGGGDFAGASPPAALPAAPRPVAWHEPERLGAAVVVLPRALATRVLGEAGANLAGADLAERIRALGYRLAEIA